MSTAPDETPDVPDGLIRIDSQAPAPDLGERIPFTLPGDDDTILWAVKPKIIIVMWLASLTAAPVVSQEEYQEFTRSCLEPEANNLIWNRLGTPADELDLPALDALMKVLTERWTARPTGGQPASARLPRTTGKRSTERSRTKASTPKS